MNLVHRRSFLGGINDAGLRVIGAGLKRGVRDKAFAFQLCRGLSLVCLKRGDFVLEHFLKYRRGQPLGAVVVVDGLLQTRHAIAG